MEGWEQNEYIKERISWAKNNARPNDSGVWTDFENGCLGEPFGPCVWNTAVWIRADCAEVDQLCTNILRNSCHVFRAFPLNIFEVHASTYIYDINVIRRQSSRSRTHRA
jgi:hypothetical protein